MSAVDKPCLLAINGGSSSIKFALFGSDEPLERLLSGGIKGVGQSKGSFSVKGPNPANNFSRSIEVADHAAALKVLVDWLQERREFGALSAVGHRVVHGGPKYWEPARITPEMIAELRQLSAFDPEHLPEELALVEAFQQRFPDLPQIACFDTAFHHDMPPVARLLPIPRRYFARGVQRYGFHGLSCAYLMDELARIGNPHGAKGRVILAHLGSGASVTAVRDGKSIDTSMAFTPTAGVPMSSRSGDLDPGLPFYLAQTEQMTSRQFNQMVNHEAGLLGVSEISADMQDLLAQEAQDVRAAEAVELFCYEVKKRIGSYAAVLGGLDTLVFAGGIGESAAVVRARICAGLGFLGLELESSRNAKNDEVISTAASRATARVIRTDEELMIARSVHRLLGQGDKTKGS